ncbi:MAG: aminotransferase class V-fold PLP-dependent enzyme, partial [Thermoguttaceae bacterium]|nr:aminotransferase class V-fold PLP-dependent enzyme [Thermoguttaceae bacterium]
MNPLVKVVMYNEPLNSENAAGHHQRIRRGGGRYGQLPNAELVAIAHAHGVRILIDGAQSVAHIPVNVTALDPDFYVFSGHKIFGPNGIGAVYGKTDALEEAQPWQGGGNMIADVTFERTVYQAAPNKFEAGTGSIADAVGLGAA